jgi:hypothetical protein
MKNQRHLSTLFTTMTGRTTIPAPNITNNVNALMGYHPSWAARVKRVR